MEREDGNASSEGERLTKDEREKGDGNLPSEDDTLRYRSRLLRNGVFVKASRGGGACRS